VHKKERQWTKGIAVGSKSFVENIKEELGFRAKGRKLVRTADIFELRESNRAYGETTFQSDTNEFYWE
jgi:hypothetical protein